MSVEEKEERLAISSAFEYALQQLGKDFARVEDAPATYHVSSLNAGYFAVLRRCCIRDKHYDIVIKRFTDSDTSYNLREAEDLCDKLNEI